MKMYLEASEMVLNLFKLKGDILIYIKKCWLSFLTFLPLCLWKSLIMLSRHDSGYFCPLLNFQYELMKFQPYINYTWYLWLDLNASCYNGAYFIREITEFAKIAKWRISEVSHGQFSRMRYDSKFSRINNFLLFFSKS